MVFEYFVSPAQYKAIFLGRYFGRYMYDPMLIAKAERLMLDTHTI